MPTHWITYFRLRRPETIYSVHELHPYDDCRIIGDEEIEHNNYNDLCNKIRARLKQLLNIQNEPLFYLSCDYRRANSTAWFKIESLNQQGYDSIDWNLPDQERAMFDVLYYTLQGTSEDSSSDSVNTSDSSMSVESLGCALRRLECILNSLD